MLALLGSLAGFVSSFIPEIFNFLRDKRDKEHEISLIKLQMEAMRTGNSSRLEEIYIQAETSQTAHLYNYAKISGIRWVDTVSSLVRPTITYSFFLLYIILKMLVFFSYHDGICLPIWTEEDQAIFCAVIGFWFGHRALGRNRLHNLGSSNGSGK